MPGGDHKASKGGIMADSGLFIRLMSQMAVYGEQVEELT